MQSKIDVHEAELSHFDLISISESGFNPNICISDVDITGFRAPFPGDRIGDAHDGVAVHVNLDTPFIRRNDFELLKIECIWLEIRLTSP